MRYVLVLALVGVMGCGGDEDCWMTHTAGGKEICVPAPRAGEDHCVIDPGHDLCTRARLSCAEEEQQTLFFLPNESADDYYIVCSCWPIEWAGNCLN